MTPTQRAAIELAIADFEHISAAGGRVEFVERRIAALRAALAETAPVQEQQPAPASKPVLLQCLGCERVGTQEQLSASTDCDCWLHTQPAPVQEPVKVGCLRCNTPKKCDVWGCSPNTFPSEQPATPADVPMLTDEDIHQMWLNSPFRGSGGQADWFKEGVRVGIQAVRQKAGLP